MQHLLLLHGAIGAADQLLLLESQLKDKYHIHRLNFSGHGGVPYAAQSFSIELFAKEVVAYLNDRGIDKVSVFGYSMGGYVAMYIAKHYPDRLNKILTLATKYHWDKETAAKEVKMLNADKIEEKVPKFAKALESRHAPNNWKDVLSKTKEMLIALGEKNTLVAEDYESIDTPSLLLLGDRDTMVTLDETINIYRILPNSSMGMIPNTPHPIEQVSLNHLTFFIREFLG